MKDYYKILQISPDAAPEVIQMAYKALAKKYHPDLNPDNAEQAQEQMKELNAAFEVLSNPEKRARYDAEQKGIKENTRLMVKKLYEINMSVEQIAKIVELDVSEVRDILKI